MALGAHSLILGKGSIVFPRPGPSTDISPWMEDSEEPPTPPPKTPRTFALHQKASFPGQWTHTRQRPSDSTSTADEHGQFYTTSPEPNAPPAVSTPNNNDRMPPSLRKPKSSINLFNRIRRSKSKPRLDEERDSPPAARTMPSLPSYIADTSFLSIGPSPSKSTTIGSTLRKDRLRGEKKKTKESPSSSAGQVNGGFGIDLNLEEMEGIVDPSRLGRPTESSPTDNFLGTSSFSSASSYTSPTHGQGSISSHGGPMFSDPFLPGTRRPYALTDPARVSPKAKILPTAMPDKPPPAEPVTDEADKTWEPPQSWNVDKEDEPFREPDYSSSDDDGGGLSRGVESSPQSASGQPSPTTTRRNPQRRVTRTIQQPKTYKVRVHRANNSYHVLTLGLAVTVVQLMPALNEYLLMPGERSMHRLYLKERGRERMLAHTERPADIVRRRLEQAGYGVADGLDTLGGEDLSFLFKFVYKSNVLGPAEEDLIFTTYEHVDLTNKSLRTVPIALYGHAEDITSLNLSRNPMLEIPLDFVQSCISLRELRLSNMSIKKVPQSVRNCTTLYGLDLSCNRIGDLNDAGLDRIPELTNLLAQNNRMEALPWYFPRLRSLRVLNISNNKFQVFPEVVCQMSSLVDLDISFNMITELPDKIGQLTLLERLVIVGNRVKSIPDGCRFLINLRELDCRRNNIEDLGAVSMLPMLEKFYVNHNAVHALDLSSGPHMMTIDACYNSITQISLLPGPVGQVPHALTSLNISHAKLSSLDDLALSQLTSLETLNLDYNNFRSIPESLGELIRLVNFSCSDNYIETLPTTIGRLQKLERLDVHNNNLPEIPASLWQCASLMRINMTSNLITVWHPPVTNPSLTPNLGSTLTLVPPEPSASPSNLLLTERKVSTASSINTVPPRLLPPLVYSLERLYLGENRLGDDALPVLMVLKELRVLNLSFNDIQEMPRFFFRDMSKLEELYMSGNKLASLPTEDLHRLTHLEVLFLNGNRLQTLPQELGKVPSLAVLDVGSNILKYNVTNWEFDWNWNFNQNLRYLNLSGNKRLEIKPDQTRKGHPSQTKTLADLAGFSGLTQLRVLGLMDVTTTFAPNIPDDNEDRRVRTSFSEVNDMQYGIADNLGNRDYVSMFDLVTPNFRERRDEAIFAMFGRSQASASNSRISKYLHDNFAPEFANALAALDYTKGEGVPDALRRAFLRLNRSTHDFLFSGGTPSRKMSTASQRSAALFTAGDPSGLGASGVVAYIKARTLYVANAGNALAVVSRRGNAQIVSTNHDPFNRGEIERIRAAEGWVSPKGLVNDEVNVSRSFGFYHLLPVVNARPDVTEYPLSDQDEFIIIANSGLWDYVSYQTAVDIARSERLGTDPMIAAQKLRDFAISYGAEGSTMIMVISTTPSFSTGLRNAADSLVDPDMFPSRPRRKDDVPDRTIARLEEEVPPPLGHLALVFTDIRNSTQLWETNGGMPTAMRMHHSLLRRQLRICGGYEVKTEGDAFMVAFQTVSAALLWCLNVQMQLLNEQWPKEILDSSEGRERRDAAGNVVERGLSLRMGIHCGIPVCERDYTTKRMDYYGPMVNRAARVEGAAAGGQIMITQDVVREIEARIFETGEETEYSAYQPTDAIDALRRLDLTVMPMGKYKLKGLEMPETLSLVYPRELLGRHYLDADAEEEAAAGMQEKAEDDVPELDGEAGPALCNADQLRELSMLCIRLQALAHGRIFRPLPPRKGSNAQVPTPEPTLEPSSDTANPDAYFYGDTTALLPTVSDRASEAEVASVLQYVLLQLEMAAQAIVSRASAPEVSLLVETLQRRNGRGIEARTLYAILDLLGD